MPETKKQSIILGLAAIAGIVILESLAILKGIDGVAFSVAIAAIAGLGGVVVDRFIITRKK